MILGNINGHVGFLGYQDRNRIMVVEQMTDDDLILLNGNDKCIDYVTGRNRIRRMLSVIYL